MNPTDPLAFDGTWYDGRGSRPRAARLSEPSPGTLRLASEGMVLEFERAGLLLSPRLGRMPRTLRLPGEGHVELADTPALEAWLGGREKIEGWADRLERRRTAAIAAGVGTVLGVVGFFQVGLPWMANRLAPVIPAAVERSVSDQAMALIERMHLAPSQLPAERQAALKEKFQALVADLPRGADFRLDLRHAPGIGANAFVLPDGRVVMTDALVTLAESDEQLLAVLAHEAGHHEQRHGMRRALQSSAVVVVAGFLFGDLSGTGSLSVSIPVILLESGFSRDFEREADAFAFTLLARKGQSPADFAEIMKRLSDSHGGDKDPGPVGYLASHPPSAERIAAARRAAEAFEPAPAAPGPGAGDDGPRTTKEKTRADASNENADAD
ncbi:MAG TPA: M48 family metallopeptidase [Arenimonas sp.]|uniref:M48 family metallopeptidase n=1 Tax=Arenimonas sp. TaxID=1872635 RepID=UPI002D7FEA44|nr:M48 family metallopeptidase [Arenimonas sp.]HEU0151798.1 M48 family metallopeptidase [Arenimonas sp.]